MNTKTETKLLQEEIMLLGACLCEKLEGRVDEQNLGFIAEYFTVNEYGEALELLNWVIAQDENFLDCSEKIMLLEINAKVSNIAELFKVE